MRKAIQGCGVHDSVQLRARKAALSAILCGSCVCLSFHAVASVHGAEKPSSPGKQAEPSEGASETPPLTLPGEDYSAALKGANLKKDRIGELQIKVSLVPDAYRYYMAKEITALRKKRWEGPKLENALRSLHVKNKEFKCKPLFLVSMAREGTESYFFLQGDLKKHVALQTTKTSRKKDFNLGDVQPKPKKQKWKIFETAPDPDPKKLNPLRSPVHERELYPFSKLDFTVVGVATQEAESDIILTIGGLVANNGGNKGGGGIHVGKTQLSCRDFKDLVCKSISFEFARSEWNIPPAPKEFEEILARIEKR